MQSGWAVDEQHADVINISIYDSPPLPSNADPTYAAIDYAWSKGVLVTVCNGNGFTNAASYPGAPGWNTSYDNSPSVLVVGVSGVNVVRMHTDPEVAGQAFDLMGADAFDADGYFSWTGTSFSAPLVAGFGCGPSPPPVSNGRVLGGDASNASSSTRPATPPCRPPSRATA